MADDPIESARSEDPAPTPQPEPQPQPQPAANGNGHAETTSDLVRKARESIPVTEHGIAPTAYQHQVTLAQDLCKAYEMLPAHLHNNVPVMSGLVGIAARFGLDPLMLASQTYEQKGRLCFQAQAFGAILYSSKLLLGRLRFEFHGEGEDMTCTVSGRFRDDPDTICMATTPPLRLLHPGHTTKDGTKYVRGSQLWDDDPEQQMAYYAERRWIRRYAPDACMGMYTREELEIEDYRSGNPLTADRLGQIETGEGWGDGSHVDLDLAAIQPEQPEGAEEPELEPVPTWTPSEAPRGYRKHTPRPATRKPAQARKPTAKGKTAPPQKTRPARPAGRRALTKAEIKAAAKRAEQPRRPPPVHRPPPWLDYVAKTEAWIQAVATAEQGDAADKRWEAERDLRDKLNVPMGERSRLRAILDRKAKAVKPKEE